MIEAPELLAAYIGGVRRLSGARSASLYVPPPLGTGSGGILVVDGAPAVPEHASMEAAEAFATAHCDDDGGPEGARVPHVPSGDPDAALIPLRPFLDPDPLAATARRHTDGPASVPEPPGAWLGLRMPEGSTDVEEYLLRTDLGEQSPSWWWAWLFGLGGHLGVQASRESSLLRDPVTGALGRTMFQSALTSHLKRAEIARRPLSLLFANPDDFGAVNHRLGRDAADEILRQLVACVSNVLRGTDVVARYGGAIYSVLLPDTAEPSAYAVAEKIAQAVQETPLGNAALRMRLSMGIASVSGDDAVPDPTEMIRRADRALSVAKRQGGGRIVVWDQSVEAEHPGHFDQLTGIFTGNTTRDYRNMVLLWEAVNVMAASEDFAWIGEQVAERIVRAFRPEAVAFFEQTGPREHRFVSGLRRAPGAAERWQPFEGDELGRAGADFVAGAMGKADTTVGWIETAPGTRTFALFFPLAARGRHLGGLLISADEPPDTFDRLFLESLAGQVAVALDRSRLAEDERRTKELEEQKLRSELDSLRQALQRARVEYHSAAMESLLTNVRRIAPTDATVLIMGESGTGKELLARTIHELSPRATRPWVVVDCGAIAQSLMDSELFGVEKGAFTGAQERRAGRLAEADGGSILLDEIGEVPLEVQSKLLRFVQEKQVVAVGGSRPKPVDVRILAATNRDLEREVAAGRFRADLYHRLNVIRLRVPPLRERPEDIAPLTQHFVALYSALYHKNVSKVSSELLERMRAYAWPGNVRELQNRVLQAVLLCESDELGVDQLPLAPPALRAIAVREPATASEPEETDPWAGLRQALAQAVEDGGRESVPPALGKWLEVDVVAEADSLAQGVLRRGAALLGVPETSFRRFLNRSRQEAARGLASRPPAWNAVRQSLRLVVSDPNRRGSDVMAALESELLAAIRERFPDNENIGAALLGVTVPTFRKRLTHEVGDGAASA